MRPIPSSPEHTGAMLTVNSGVPSWKVSGRSITSGQIIRNNVPAVRNVNPCNTPQSSLVK